MSNRLIPYSDHDLILTSEDYRQVYSAMDGSNLTGLAHSAWEIMCLLLKERNARTDAGHILPPKWLQHHPLITLWMDKLCQLTDFDSMESDEILDCYQFVRDRS